MSSVTSSHYFEDHIGEVRLCILASTLAGLFEEAARALSELMLDTSSGASAEAAEAVAIQARDLESLLVAWLNELIFLSETRRRIYTDVRVHSVSDTTLEASVSGVFPQALKTAVKAATMHDVKVERVPDGYTATVVLDV